MQFAYTRSLEHYYCLRSDLRDDAMKPYKEIVQIMPVSDGDPSHRPKNSDYIQITRPTLYLEKIANLWMQNLHQARPGKQPKNGFGSSVA